MMSAIPIRFLNPTNSGWARAWTRIAETFRDPEGNPDPEGYNARSGEVWQYMGSYADFDGRNPRHEFRHRDFPGRGRICCKVPALDSDWR
ncbi:MAG: hypothetical protein WC789_10555 [Lentisphaeria bacterium]